MLAVGEAVGGTGGCFTGIHDLVVSRGGDGLLLLGYRSADTANDPLGLALLGTGRRDSGQDLIIVGGEEGGGGLLSATEGTDALQQSLIGTSGGDRSIPLTKDMITHRTVIGGRSHLIAGHKAQCQCREDQP